MREFLYLSDAKLDQFIPAKKSWGNWFSRVEGEVKVPFFSAKIGAPSAETGGNHDHLYRVIDEIESFARWYQEDNLRPGDWIAFECNLSSHVVRLDPEINDLRRFAAFPPIALFVEHSDHANSLRRLILHGSPHHLLGSGIEKSSSDLPILSGSAPNALVEMMLRVRSITSLEKPSWELEAGDFEVIDPFVKGNQNCAVARPAEG
jgi:hypothetical protein